MTGSSLFAYGTLMSEEILRGVTGKTFSRDTAVLHGFGRYALRGEVYPGLVEETNGSVEGVVYYRIPDAAWRLLDRFEGSGYRKIDVRILCGDTAVAARTYLLRPELHSLSQTPWSFEAFMRTDFRSFSAAIPPLS